jgi:hypothetical protein
MDRFAYIFDGGLFNKVINTVTFSSTVGNYAYWKNSGAVNESFNGLGEEIPTDIINNDGRNAYFWNHIEDKNIRVQGFFMVRSTMNIDDNIYRISRNGISYIDTIQAGVGVPDVNKLIGVVFWPMTDRLNA